MRIDYACVATVKRDGLTLKGLRADFADPNRLVGCGEFPRLAARGFAATRRGELIELRFTISNGPDIGEAARRAAGLVDTLARGRRLRAPVVSLAVTVEPNPRATLSPPASEAGRTRCS